MKSFKTLRIVMNDGAQSKFTYLGLGILVFCALGCRSKLPAEQPSRLWEVFGRQTGRFHPISGADVARERSGGSPVIGPAQVGLSLPPSGYDFVSPVDGAAVSQSRTNAALPHAYSAQMIPPLPREIR